MEQKLMTQAARPAFVLDPQLERDCFLIGDLALCQVLLMNDARYPWLILVPRVADISEIYQLNLADQQQLLTESSALSKAMSRHFQADKMNIASLGNIVSQLHMHLIVRFEHDPAWPGPVWGQGTPVHYHPIQLDNRRQEMQSIISKA